MNKIGDFTTGSIPKKLTRFMLPVFGALILQAMYGAVDLLIVGQFGTDAGISGVSTGSSIMHMITLVLTSLSTGVTVLIGSNIGSGQTERIGKVIGGAIAFFIAASLVLTGVLVIFAREIAILMQTPEEAIDLTADYIRICGGGFVFVVLYNLISSIFRGLGDSNSPLLFVGIACVVNIVGDLLFVAVFNMNVAGAAIATVLAQAISVIISVIIIAKRKLPFKFSVKDIGFNREIKEFIKIGSPLALQEFLTHTTFLFICAFINNLGLDASSGYGIAQKVQSFIMLIPSSIMQSMASFVSQNVGAGNGKRAKDAMKFGMIMGCSIGVFVALFTFFKGDLMASVFTQNETYIARAFDFLHGFAPDAIITNILFSFVGYFNGNGKSLFVMIQGLIQSCLIRLPFSYVMSIQPDASLTYIGLAIPAATVIGIIMCTVYFFRIKKDLLKDTGSNIFSAD